MDATATGITFGVIATTIYTAVRAVRQGSFDVGATALTFLAGFSVPGGILLIATAWLGDIHDLPSSWREYMAAAGVIAIGLSGHYLFKSIRNVWVRRATLSSQEAGAIETE